MMMNWKIKKYASLSLDELYKILQLRNEVFVVAQDCVYQDADGKDIKAFHLFAKQQDELIAYARIFKSGDYFDKASIGRVVVSPKYRGQKLGKQLMQKAIDFTLTELKEKVIEISAQTYLDKFYKELSFIPYGETYLEDGLPHIRMIFNRFK